MRGGGSKDMGSALKINLCTLPYRPPEIILGDHGFGNEIDSWSLGCVALEALQGEVLINSEVEVDALVQIFTTMGGPLPDGYLSKLPEFKSPYSCIGRPSKKWWPPPCLRDEVSLADTLGSLLQIEPPSRMTAAAASASPGLLGYERLRPTRRNVPAQRGPLTLTQANLEPALLALLQSDPYWNDVCTRLESDVTGRACRPLSEQKLGLKIEELGHVGDEPPETSRCNNMQAKAPLPARSVRAFLRAFLAKNEPALLELQRRIKVGLQKLPRSYLGDNGEDFLKADIMKTAFCYAHIQVMRARQRRDPPHYDGGASWLHMGLTIFGRRKLHWNLPAQDSANGNFSNTADSPPRPSHKIILFARPRSDPMIRRTRASTGSGNA